MLIPKWPISSEIQNQLDYLYYLHHILICFSNKILSILIWEFTHLYKNNSILTENKTIWIWIVLIDILYLLKKNNSNLFMM